MLEENERFHYIHSCDFDVNLQVKVGTLEGDAPVMHYRRLLEDPLLTFCGLSNTRNECSDARESAKRCDLFVDVALYAGPRTGDGDDHDQQPMTLPARTAYRPFGKYWNWNEWIELAISCADIPLEAILRFTIHDVYSADNSIVVGYTEIPVYDSETMCLQRGLHDLRVNFNPELTDLNTVSLKELKVKQMERNRLEELSRQYKEDRISRIDWLDRLTFREIEVINEKTKRFDSHALYLNIEFPAIQYEATPYSLVYFEKGNDQQIQTLHNDIDPEIGAENLLEQKHHKLTRSLRSDLIDRELKPNTTTRDQLNAILDCPITKVLNSDEQDLLWKYRFYLCSHKRALAKFLKCVDWSTEDESSQALKLMNNWAKDRVDISDALELLSVTFKGRRAVREYAIDRLSTATESEIQMYLLQLVQALKYEDYDDIKVSFERQLSASNRRSRPVIGDEGVTVGNSCFVSFIDDADLDDPASPSLTSAHPRRGNSAIDDENFAYDDHHVDASCSAADDSSYDDSSHRQQCSRVSMELTNETRDTLLDAIDDDNSSTKQDLSSFLIQRACQNNTMSNYLFWYLIVECDQKDEKKETIEMYVTVLKKFSHALNIGGSECVRRRAMIAEQQSFIEKLVKVVQTVQSESANRKKKIEKLKVLLSDPSNLNFNFVNFNPIPLPLDPNVKIQGIVVNNATLFKSNLMPCRFTFRTTTGHDYITIFKNGDDLRQDQLILQIISLMDQLLQTENLDLKLTPYKVLATSTKHGLLQFIESQTIAEVLAEHGSITDFLRKQATPPDASLDHAPSSSSSSSAGAASSNSCGQTPALEPNDIDSVVLDNYIRSCAGYCVITYLLGVGDRHLDNVLICTSGRMFHIDFGFILGRDPKPMPPPMKLTREMIEPMVHRYSEFLQLCTTCFLHLRRSSNLILSLFSLMIDSHIQDIALEPDKTVRKVHDKFRLDLSEEEAVVHLKSVIDASSSALVSVVIEQMHKITQFLVVKVFVAI